MRLNPHLNFDGQCEAAFRFYETRLGGKVLMLMAYEGSPLANDVAPEWRSKILHASMTIGDQTLMGSDAPPGQYERPQGFAVVMGLADPNEAERKFAALAEGGTVRLPIQETFWATRFGMLVDRYGIPWMINCGKQG